MRSVAAAILTVLSAGCARSASAPGPAPVFRGDSHDRAYLALRLRDEGCQPRMREACCPVLQQRLDEALSRDELATAATALDALAIACPDRRDNALAALEHKTRTSTTPEAGTVTVAYSARIGPADRLYWVSAYLDGKNLAGAPIAPGPHVLDVEIHVMTASGTEEDALFRIRTRKELTLEPRASRRFVATLRHRASAVGGSPFTLDLLDKDNPAPPVEPGTDAQPQAPSEPPDKIPGLGRLKRFPNPRLPSELSRGTSWTTMLKVCVERGGRVDSMTPILDTPHPRLLGVLFDSLAHAEYIPYAVNGSPVPFCYPLRITVSPG